MKMGKSLVVFEGGEAMRFDEQSIQSAILGTKKVLAHFEMIEFKSETQESYQCTQSNWIRAKSSGLLKLHKTSGNRIKNKEVLATITDPFGQFETKIKATYDGIVIGHTNAPLVNKGDAIFHIGN